ncbi:polysaccharide pyruvyl transferase family protein [Limnobacter sp.]|uniref:polysaccharide pyruvyl transferase family protein n=1 Tax=Limnobacter sp. TaxID=2003368 RepID=UPI00311F1E05
MQKSNYMYWYKGAIPNFGDDLSPLLASLISNRRFKHIRHGVPWIKTSKYFIGSIIHHAKLPYSFDLCGAGCIDNESRIFPPNKCYAVRGKYTWQRVEKFKSKKKVVLGDPALLIKNFADKIIDPTIDCSNDFKVSFVPHYTDLHLTANLNCNSVNVIDVRQDPRVVITKIAQSSYVVSSSLHGLIVAQSFNIPALWIGIGNKIYGGDFKFQDFFSSLGISNAERTDVNWGDSILDYINHRNTICKEYKHNSDLLFALEQAFER